MKKIPTLFKREFENHKVVKVLNEITPGMEWVLEGEGTATVKYDGSCCAIIEGEFYKRYDCKKGKTPPEGFIPCCEPDEITGHWPGWIKCNRNNPEDKWFWEAYDNCLIHDSMVPNVQFTPIKKNELYFCLPNNTVTLEACGLHFQGNPYNFKEDGLIFHGEDEIEIERTFDGIKNYLSENYIEGIVFWRDGEPQCKIKRSDFGFEWNKKQFRKNKK